MGRPPTSIGGRFPCQPRSRTPMPIRYDKKCHHLGLRGYRPPAMPMKRFLQAALALIFKLSDDYGVIGVRISPFAQRTTSFVSS